MNTIKNFIYNISDILVALLIIIAAVLIIGWRVDAIMHYPQELNTQRSDAEDVVASEPADDTVPADNTSDSSQNANSAAQSVTVNVVQNDSLSTIAQSLVTAGAISDAQQFIDAVNAANAATKLKFGTYTIPAGTSIEEIIQMMM